MGVQFGVTKIKDKETGEVRYKIKPPVYEMDKAGPPTDMFGKPLKKKKPLPTMGGVDDESANWGYSLDEYA